MRKFLIEFLLAVLAMLPGWVKDQYAEGSGPGALEKRLRAKLEEEGWTCKK